MRTIGQAAVVGVACGLGLVSGASASTDLGADVLSPLVPVSALAERGPLAAAVALRIDAAATAALGRFSEPPPILMPIGDRGSVLVELSRVDPFAPGARAVNVTEQGEVEVPLPSVQVWRGRVLGDGGSSVFLGLSGEQAHGWIETEGRRYWITTKWAGGVASVVSYDSSMWTRVGGLKMPSCAGAVAVPGMDLLPATGPDGTPAVFGTGSCRVYDVALDSDNELLASFGNNATTTQDYMTLIVAASSEIYDRDVGVGLRVSFIRTWSATDPWTSTSTSDQLPQFRTYWNTNQTSTPRSIAHMIANRALGGGIAYLRSICNTNAYGVNASINRLGGLFPYPIVDNAPGNSNWDLMVTAHEMGHNLGTGHTHCNSEFSPIVDGCGLAPTGRPPCETGTTDCSVGTARNGTIMSYCHLCGLGVEAMKMTFGTRVSQRMQAFQATVPTCGTITTPPALASVTPSVPYRVCPTAQVTLSASATGQNLTYQWFRNGAAMPGERNATLVVAGSLSGTYSVIVRNGCGVINSASTGQTVVRALLTADFNADGVRTPADLFAFLNAYFAGEARTDVSGNGVRAPEDIFAFLTLYFTGSC
jgi:hypothetical protein